MSALLRIQVHPGARQERLRGWRGDGSLRVEVAAAPEAGKANEAVMRLLAGSLGVRRAAVTLKRGAGSRSKVIEVEGLDDVELRTRIERALGEGAGDGE